jgi:hypothetical protein
LLRLVGSSTASLVEKQQQPRLSVRTTSVWLLCVSRPFGDNRLARILTFGPSSIFRKHAIRRIQVHQAWRLGSAAAAELRDCSEDPDRLPSTGNRVVVSEVHSMRFRQSHVANKLRDHESWPITCTLASAHDYIYQNVARIVCQKRSSGLRNVVGFINFSNGRIRLATQHNGGLLPTRSVLNTS